MNSCFENEINGSFNYFPKLPFDFQRFANEPISIFGFTLFFEDILIISLALFLFSQDDCDMLLIACLVLILLT